MIKNEIDIARIQRFCVGVCVGGFPPTTFEIAELARFSSVLQNSKYFWASILSKNTIAQEFCCALNCVPWIAWVTYAISKSEQKFWNWNSHGIFFNPGIQPSDGQSCDKSREVILFLISQSDIDTSEIFESRKIFKF